VLATQPAESEPSSDAARQVGPPGRIIGGGGRRWRRGRRGAGEVLGAVGFLPVTCGVDLSGCPLSGPADSVAGDPIVGSAGEAPVADRGAQRDGVAVEGKAPLDWSDRGDDLLAAAAQAQVRGGGVGDADVDDALVEGVGHGVDELVLDGGAACHA